MFGKSSLTASKTKNNTKIKNKKKTPIVHYFVLSYVYLLIFANMLTVVITFAIYQMGDNHLLVSMNVILGGLLFSGLNMVFLFAITRWRKWGFWGYCVATLLGMGFSIYALQTEPQKALTGVLTVAILYFLLNLGGKNKAWRRLT